MMSWASGLSRGNADEWRWYHPAIDVQWPRDLRKLTVGLVDYISPTSALASAAAAADFLSGCANFWSGDIERQVAVGIKEKIFRNERVPYK